jgi:hypothetical protein
MAEHNFTKAQSEPVFTADGQLWCLNCYICDKQINFLKAPSESYRKVGQYVRHMKCYPPPLK